MTAVTQLGYLGISVSDISEWDSYAQNVLKVRVAGREPDDTLLLQIDDQHHRFALHQGAEDDIAYFGWQVDNAAAGAEIAARLEAAGTPVAQGTAEERERRRVGGLITFDDPDGYRCEVFWDRVAADSPYESPRTGRGFVAEDLGLGHFVLASGDLQRAMDFYTSMLGMKVSDYISLPNGPTLGFLHCNPRHHSLAFIDMPNARKKINHFMLQLEDMNDVGKTYDQAEEGGARLLSTLGRHSNDYMVSFYMANPSRFGVEYGWGGREIDDRTWEIEHLNIGSFWGHKPVREQAVGSTAS